jgi:hypothetical protein
MKEKTGSMAQSERFIEAARKLGCDDDPAHFDETLKKVARHKPPPNAAPESEERFQKAPRIVAKQKPPMPTPKKSENAK